MAYLAHPTSSLRAGALLSFLILISLPWLPSTRLARANFAERGDVNGDGIVDISDAILLFDWLTTNPSGAICLSMSDANLDGTVDYSDGLYLLNYMFLSGHTPVPQYPGGQPGCYTRAGAFELRNIRAVVFSPTSALVAWETAIASDSRVRYGESRELEAEGVLVDEAVLHHQVLLEGLSPDTTYYFTVSSEAPEGSSVSSKSRSFQTLPKLGLRPPASHPRIFFTEADLAGIRGRIGPGGVHEEHWSSLSAWCGTRLERDAEDIFQSDHFLVTIRALAFAALIGENDAYRRKAVELALHCIENGGGDDYRSATEGLAYVYDWLYGSLTSGQKAEIAAALYKYAKAIRGTIHEDEYVTGRSHGNNKAYFLASLSLFGDDDRVSPFLAESIQHYHHGFLAIWRRFAGGDGGSSKGWWYSTYVLPFELEFLAALKSAMRLDWFPQERDWCESALSWFLFGLRGDDSLLVDGDTWVQYGLEHQNRVYGRLIAKEYGNAQAQWFADQAERVAGVWAPRAVFDILWHDPSVPSTPPAGVTSRWFRNVGTVVCRESWSADAAIACFRSPEAYTLGHTHRDSCSFTLFYKGDLALDSGTYDEYGSDHYENYYTRTVAHNSILVYDPDEVFVKYGKTYANDGGQRWLVPGEDVESSWPTSIEATVDRARGYRLGGLPRYEDDPHYTYALGDGGPAYSPAKLSKFHRQFLWLKKASTWAHPVLVIFDDVVATSDSFRKTYLLHTELRPVVDGTLVSAESGEGALYQFTVAPAEAEIRLVGGKGREFQVGNTNWAPVNPPADKETVGAWRVEVSPVSKQKDHRFLHVLYPGDKGAKPPVRPKSLSTGTFQGATIGEWVVLFGYGEPLVLAEYESPAPRAKHLIAGAVPLGKYTLLRDGEPQETIVASFAGVLRFETDVPGNVRVVAEP